MHHAADQIGRADQLHHLGAAFLQAQRGREVLLVRRQVDAEQRARHAAAHRAAQDQHLLDGDVVGLAAPEVHAGAVADRDQVDAGAVGDLRHLVIPRDHADDLAAFAFHFLQG